MLNARVAEFAEETLIGKVAIRKVVALSLSLPRVSYPGLEGSPADDARVLHDFML